MLNYIASTCQLNITFSKTGNHLFASFFSPHKVYLAQRWNHLNLKILKLVSCEIWPVKSRLYYFFLKELHERLPSHTVIYSSVRHRWNSFRNLVKLEVFHTNVRIVCQPGQKVSCDWDWDGVRPIARLQENQHRVCPSENTARLSNYWGFLLVLSLGLCSVQHTYHVNAIIEMFLFFIIVNGTILFKFPILIVSM